ncbi:MAG: DUF2922 domain-containing protein [Bacillota bacterium]|nr:DUF2922 domain-containing protein [Bacillota bacterium]
MSKTLAMTFINADGKKTCIRLQNVKPAVTKDEVIEAMNVLITKNIFDTTGGDLKQIDSAVLEEKSSEELAVR